MMYNKRIFQFLLCISIGLINSFPLSDCTDFCMNNTTADHHHHKHKDWWETTIFYQIYPRSFKDSNGDGIGDINGITSKLEHLKESGIGATWLSPIFDSPMVDFGYDISNFTQIHEEYGTMEDFEMLMNKAKKLGIKIILDFVPNHSSDKCEWFRHSVNRMPGFEDFYVWHDGKPNPSGDKPLPPNNWVSVFYGSAWTWNDKRKQYYLHQFTAGQPDLNFNNSNVVEEMNKVLRFWLEKGVDGFRVDAINHMFEVDSFRDEPLSGKSTDPNDYNYLDHIYTKNLPQTYEMIYGWRKLMDDFKREHGGDTRVMMTEAYTDIKDTMRYYESSDGKRKGAHMPFNFRMISDLNVNSDARDLLFTINKWLVYMPVGETANWVLGNHDQKRVGTRYGAELIDVMNMLLLTLPGVAVTYNGDEIGMLDNSDISWLETKDPAACNTNEEVYKLYSRDPTRTPFQWDNTSMAGFTTSSKTWLPVHPNYKSVNLKAQKEAKNSHYKIYQRLAELRKTKTLMYGDFKGLALNLKVFASVRSLKSYETIVIVLNLGDKSTVIDLSEFGGLPDTLLVHTVGLNSKLKEGTKVITKHLKLTGYDSIVLTSASTNSSFKLKSHLNIFPFFVTMACSLFLFKLNKF